MAAPGVRGSGLTTVDDGLAAARALLLAGDRDGLARILDADPGLVRRRFASRVAPYDGYFHGANILHHVAGNPRLAGLPSGIVSLTGLLLERGAEVDAVTLQGPSQPDDIGWTPLGLVASSEEARVSGVQLPLMDLLLEAGADPDARNGGCLMGALFYGESRAAEHLARRGARLDLVAAAGVGDTEILERILTADALPARLVHYNPVPWPEGAGREASLAVALAYAALHGRLGALTLLLEHGAEASRQGPVNGSALHWAVLGDQAQAVRLLVDAGARRDARDAEHRATPEEWARHLGRTAAADALQ